MELKGEKSVPKQAGLSSYQQSFRIDDLLTRRTCIGDPQPHDVYSPFQAPIASENASNKEFQVFNEEKVQVCACSEQKKDA